MTEHPIIFTGPMVRAILDGSKTQTRRVIKPQPACGLAGAYFDKYDDGPQWNWWTLDSRVVNSAHIHRCPYGKPGDTVWVKETWQVYGYSTWTCRLEPFVGYKADDSTRNRVCFQKGPTVPGNEDLPIVERFPAVTHKWRSSRYMPRWVCRLLLRVKSVRVERVQDIGNVDALREGCNIDWRPAPHDPISQFAALWNTINAKRGYGWDKNPHVWVVEFERIGR